MIKKSGLTQDLEVAHPDIVSPCFEMHVNILKLVQQYYTQPLMQELIIINSMRLQHKRYVMMLCLWRRLTNLISTDSTNSNFNNSVQN